MSKRDLIKRLVAGEPVERCGFWLGNPDAKTWPILHRHFGTRTEEELRVKAGDDCRWICPQFFDDVYQDPEGRMLFDAGLDREAHVAQPLANCETIEEVNAYPWPNPEYLRFDSCLRALDNAGDVYRLSGFWTCFYHNIADLFGMEEYFVKMYTHPEVVRAVTDKVCEFYFKANERFFAAAGRRVDGFFFGNDFGTQCSLICGPAQFDEFILPWFIRFTQQGKAYGYQVVLHSCGSIYPVIERLITAGVQCLHPLQALATNMDAETLARDFKGRITFMGGVDAQQLLTNGTPEQIRADVRRVKNLLGPNLILSPSHEAILPNVPPANVQALIEAAHENHSSVGKEQIMTTRSKSRHSSDEPLDSVNPEALDHAFAFIEGELAAGTFPGAAMMATVGGRLIAERYWGTYCGIERDGLPLSAGVTHMLYSFSKGISATVVAMVRQDGLLDYDSPISAYIPGYGRKAKEAITLRHLLTHSAGIPTPPYGALETEEDWDAAVEACCEGTVEWAPGSKTAYHWTTGLFLAAECARRVTPGRPSWDTICRERLFGPIGAESLSFNIPAPSAPLARTPYPEILPSPINRKTFGSIGHPGAGCFGRIEDMIKVLRLHLQRGVWQGKALLSPTVWAEMHTVQYAAEITAALSRGEGPKHEYWGLGWLLRGETKGDGWFGFGKLPSEQAFGHAGRDTVMGIGDPAHDLALAFITTRSPDPKEKTSLVRNKVTDLVAAAIE